MQILDTVHQIEPPAAPGHIEARAKTERGLEAIGVGRRADRERQRDMAVLGWVARFAFVSVGTLALRWEVSEQRMRDRVRRLAGEGLVEIVRLAPSYPRAIALTRRGAAELGLALPRSAHRRPRAVGHELAIVKCVMAAEAELAETGVQGRVCSEREQRRREAAGLDRYSVETIDVAYRRRRRWPDYVIETPGRRVAVELEFSPKTTARLEAIGAGYLRDLTYDSVEFVLLEDAEGRALARRLGPIVREELALARAPSGVLRELIGSDVIRVLAWGDPYPHLHAGLYPFVDHGRSRS